MLGVDDPDIGAQVESQRYRLAGVTYDPHDERVEIMLGDAANPLRHLTRSVFRPASVALTTHAGTGDVVEFRHGKGHTLLVILPEQHSPAATAAPSIRSAAMKTDIRLHQDLLDEFEWDPAINDAEIGLAVRDGVVTLTGTVDTFAQKYAAERAAERVSGVRAIANDLTVKLPTSHERTDTEIAHAAAQAIAWNSEVAIDSVKVRVEDGWIWLDGTVEWKFQKDAAERAVRHLTGVKFVSNLIAVKPKQASPPQVAGKINLAFRRSAVQHANQIEVETHDGTVSLAGTVRSLAERRDAEQAAWLVPGVTVVDNRIEVRP